MAEKRMISKVISISEKVNELPDIFDMLLFTWMIPHADDFGRLAGSPGKVKALIVPMLDKSMADIKASLQRLNDHELIIWYEVDGDKVVQIIQFEKHQQGLHKRTKSKFPDFPGTSGNFPTIPPELNRTELKGTEEKRTEEKRIEQEEKGTDSEEHQNPVGGSSPPTDDPNPFRMFENEGFGTISSVIADSLNDHIETYGKRWVCEAMRVSVFQGKRKLSYVDGILKSWKADGVDEPWNQEKKPRAAPFKTYNGGRSGKQIIEIAKDDGKEGTPTEAEFAEMMAEAKAYRDKKRQEAGRQGIRQ